MPYCIENAVCTHETEKAIVIVADEFLDSVWIPKSQIDDDSEVWKKGQKGNCIISDWIAEQKGLL